MKNLLLLFVLVYFVPNTYAQYPVNRSGVSVVDGGGIEPWEAGGTAYDINDVVYVNDKIYVAITLHASSLVFNDDIANWIQLSAGGSYKWVTGTAYNLEDIVYDELTNKLYRCITAHTASALFASDLANWTELSAGIFPIASATDNAIPRWDGVTGDLVQDSGVIVDDLNDVTGVNDLTTVNDVTVGNDLSTIGQATIGTDLTVTNDTSVGNNLSVTGTTTLDTALDGVVKSTAGVISAGDLDLTSEVGTSILPIANGGTNSARALTNDFVIKSELGSLVESGVGIDSSNNITTTGDLTVGQGTGLEFDLIQSLYRARSTGVAAPPTITANVGDNTTFDVSAVEGQVVNTNTSTYSVIDFAGATGVTPLVPTSGASYIYLTAAGVLSQQATPLTPSQRRLNVFLGRVITNASSEVAQTIVNPTVTENATNLFRDLADAIGIFNIEGNRLSANGANLSLDRSSGKLFDASANYTVDRQDPNRITLASCSVCTLFLNTRSSFSVIAETELDPTMYDNGGVLTSISGSNNRATNQRVFIFPSGNLVVQYGQQVYSSLANAVSGSASEDFESNPINVGGVLLATISITKGATDLTDESEVSIKIANKFGGNGGAGGGASNIQEAYTNSLDGKIQLDSTRGAFKVADNDTASIEAPLFQVLGNLATSAKKYFEVGLNYILNPVRTIAERPIVGVQGMQGFNSDDECLEVYNGTEWQCVGSGGGGSAGINFVVDGSFEKEELALDTNLGFTPTYELYTADAELASEFNEKYWQLTGNLPTLPVLPSIRVSDTYARTGLDGKQGFFSAWVNITSVDTYPLSLCITTDDPTYSGDCSDALTVDLIGDGTWRKVEIPFVFGASSVEFRIEAAEYAGAVTIKVDKVYVGTAPDGLIREVDTGLTDWKPYTPTIQGFGTFNTLYSRWRKVGDSIEISIRGNIGTRTAQEVQIGLPDSLLLDNSYSTVVEVGRLDVSINTEAHYSVLATGGDNFFNVGFRAAGGNGLFAPSLGSAILSDSAPIQIIAKAKIQGWSVENSTITTQNIELTAQTANSMSARISSTGSITQQDFDFIDSVTKNGTGRYDVILKSGIFTERGAITSTATDSSSTVALVGGYSSPTVFSIYTRNTANALVDDNFDFTIHKQGADVNRSQVIAGTFEGINSTDLVVVEGEGNNGGALSADVTPISFTETTDNQNVWDGTTFTTNKKGLYEFQGQVRLTSASGPNIYYWLDTGSGYTQQKITTASVGSEIQIPFKFKVSLSSGDKIQLRSDVNVTQQNNTSLHYITITQSADHEAIVENLNANPRLKNDQYSETEMKWGLWNGEQLYRRCFTVTSQATTSGQVLDTWDSNLNPKGILNRSADQDFWDIFSSSNPSSSAFITYQASTGQVQAFFSGTVPSTGFLINAGTSFCMDYTR